MTLLWVALCGLIALSSGEHHDVTIREGGLLGFNLYAAQTFGNAFVVTVYTAKAGIDKDRSLIEGQFAQLVVKCIQSYATPSKVNHI